MILKMRPIVLSALAVGALLVIPAQAQMEKMITTTKTASLGQVAAVLSYQEATFSNPLADWRLYQPRLKVIRDGQTVLDEPLPAGQAAEFRQIDGPEVYPLQGGGEPEILLKIGAVAKQPGALLIYRYDPATHHYVLSQQADTGKIEVSTKVETRRVVRSKNLQAELSFPEDIMVTGQVNLKITRDGKTFSEIITLGEDENIAQVEGPMLIDFERTGEPEVVLNVSSQHAYCCSFTFIYHYVPARNTYALLKHCWTNYRNQASLQDLDKDGGLEFVSRNEDFSGEFGPYAVSGAAPIQIWRYQQGRLQEVTGRYSDLIRQDAQGWWEEYQQKESDWYHQPMPLTAYLADMYLLGQGQKGWQQVRQVYQAKDRQEFFGQLRRELKKHGYAK
ncbi:MAG: hypothetical protein WCF59_13225 [Desulfobaccales bacterium]